MKAVLRVLGASLIVLVWPAVRWIVMLLGGGLFSIALWELAELGSGGVGWKCGFNFGP